jgi:hypothetical protein
MNKSTIICPTKRLQVTIPRQEVFTGIGDDVANYIHTSVPAGDAIREIRRIAL